MKNLKNKLKRKSGFTLIEMLIVVAIIAILVAVSIPMMTGALDNARAQTDAANLRAAKAEAMILIMNNLSSENKLTGANYPYYYHAEDGTLEYGTPPSKNYGQVADHHYIRVIIDYTKNEITEIGWA